MGYNMGEKATWGITWEKRLYGVQQGRKGYMGYNKYPYLSDLCHIHEDCVTVEPLGPSTPLFIYISNVLAFTSQNHAVVQK